METTVKDMRLSPTSVLCYLRNPREFYYKYVCRMQTPTSKHMIKGSVVHRVLEKFFILAFKPDMDSHMEEIFVKVWKEFDEEWSTLPLTDEESLKEKEDCMNQIQLFLRTFRIKMDGLKQAGKAENDRHAFYLLKPKLKEMWVDDKDLNVGGYIDRIHTDFDGWVTVGDYKTSSRFGIGTKKDYIIQCGIYAYLYQRRFDRVPDFVSVIYLRYGDEVSVMVTPELVKFATDKVKYVRERIQTEDIEDYPRNESDRFFSFQEMDAGIMAIKDDARRKRVIAELKAKAIKEKITRKKRK